MFFSNFSDKRIMYIIMAIMIIIGLQNRISNPDSLVSLLLTIPGLLIAITFHEFAHAFAADKLGDDTPRLQGRLTLNPLAHLDPIGSVMLLFAGFGWGKPVQVNPTRYDRRMSMEKADAIVSLAGPLMNFVLAIIFTIIYCAILKFVKIESQALVLLLIMVQATISINIGLGVFNLIPLPPLDGSKIIKPILPYNAKMWLESHEQIIELIFVILWATNNLSRIISPIINAIYNLIINFGASIFGIM